MPIERMVWDFEHGFTAACLNALCAVNSGAQLLAHSPTVFKRLQQVLSAACVPNEFFAGLCQGMIGFVCCV